MTAAQVVSFKIWGQAFTNTGDSSPYRAYHQPLIHVTNTFQCWVYRNELSRQSVVLLALTYSLIKSSKQEDKVKITYFQICCNVKE